MLISYFLLSGLLMFAMEQRLILADTEVQPFCFDRWPAKMCINVQTLVICTNQTCHYSVDSCQQACFDDPLCEAVVWQAVAVRCILVLGDTCESYLVPDKTADYYELRVNDSTCVDYGVTTTPSSTPPPTTTPMPCYSMFGFQFCTDTIQDPCSTQRCLSGPFGCLSECFSNPKCFASVWMSSARGCLLVWKPCGALSQQPGYDYYVPFKFRPECMTNWTSTTTPAVSTPLQTPPAACYQRYANFFCPRAVYDQCTNAACVASNMSCLRQCMQSSKCLGVAWIATQKLCLLFSNLCTIPDQFNGVELFVLNRSIPYCLLFTTTQAPPSSMSPITKSTSPSTTTPPLQTCIVEMAGKFCMTGGFTECSLGLCVQSATNCILQCANLPACVGVSWLSQGVTGRCFLMYSICDNPQSYGMSTMYLLYKSPFGCTTVARDSNGALITQTPTTSFTAAPQCFQLLQNRFCVDAQYTECSSTNCSADESSCVNSCYHNATCNVAAWIGYSRRCFLIYTSCNNTDYYEGVNLYKYNRTSVICGGTTLTAKTQSTTASNESTTVAPTTVPVISPQCYTVYSNRFCMTANYTECTNSSCLKNAVSCMSYCVQFANCSAISWAFNSRCLLHDTPCTQPVNYQDVDYYILNRTSCGKRHTVTTTTPTSTTTVTTTLALATIIPIACYDVFQNQFCTSVYSECTSRSCTQSDYAGCLNECYHNPACSAIAWLHTFQRCFLFPSCTDMVPYNAIDSYQIFRSKPGCFAEVNIAVAMTAGIITTDSTTTFTTPTTLASSSLGQISSSNCYIPYKDMFCVSAVFNDCVQSSCIDTPVGCVAQCYSVYNCIAIGWIELSKRCLIITGSCSVPSRYPGIDTYLVIRGRSDCS